MKTPFNDNIQDIILDGDSFTIIREFKITSKDIESQVRSLSYSGEKKGIDAQVEKAELPAFIQPFYTLFCKKFEIPTEENFIDLYIKFLGGVKDNKVAHNGILYEYVGIRNRLLRTYPSLIRELHFLYLLKESKKFDSVRYSMKRDYYDGLDIEIVINTKQFFIALFNSTVRADKFKNDKENRHDYSSVKQIRFSPPINTLKTFGKINLLTKEHVEELIKLL